MKIHSWLSSLRLFPSDLSNAPALSSSHPLVQSVHHDTLAGENHSINKATIPLQSMATDKLQNTSHLIVTDLETSICESMPQYSFHISSPEWLQPSGWHGLRCQWLFSRPYLAAWISCLHCSAYRTGVMALPLFKWLPHQCSALSEMECIQQVTLVSPEPARMRWATTMHSLHYTQLYRRRFMQTGFLKSGQRARGHTCVLSRHAGFRFQATSWCPSPKSKQLWGIYWTQTTLRMWRYR